MCGILSVVNFKNNINSGNLVKALNTIRHRGPDDEGLLTWLPGETPRVWAGADTASSTKKHFNYEVIGNDQPFKVGFGHRRLSIVDLSPGGHQPMLHSRAGLAITFNGEIYNYPEIRNELIVLGHEFKSASDTEVILHAWEQWGAKCLDKFNGMFAFVILDHNKRELYAVRDRFGVKPLYYYEGTNALYLSSEIKQIKTSPDYSFELNVPIARQFLASGVSEHTDNTFDAKIKLLAGGHYIKIDLSAERCQPEIVKWYTLVPKRWSGSFDNAVTEFRNLLTDAVRLRLRSDVKVGSCLSGGLDSSSIVCIAANLLKAQGDFAGQETVTACYDSAKYDEWNFANEVVKSTNAHPHKVFPSFSGLQEEIDSLLWHQDEPVGSTSVYSQWCVFKACHEAGLKVMIDGQGADEQLAGYGGNDLPFYAGLLGKGHLLSLYDEAIHYKKESGSWPKGFLTGAMQLNMGKSFTAILPDKIKIKTGNGVDWLVNSEPAGLHSEPATSLQQNLLRQLYGAPLPALLRYEDHNSMAWSVESRTPFMDYRLLEFNLGLPERFVYKRGVRKAILREAMHNIIPDAVANRKDKMGFVTPEELWLKGTGKTWFMDGVDKACKQFGGTILDTESVRSYISGMIDGKRPFNFVPWRILCFNRWFETVK
jgi:asparagine synthase (glutamine-hydrolysing)